MSNVLRNTVVIIGSAVSLGLAGGSFFVKSAMRPVPVEERYARFEPPVELEWAQATHPEDLTAPMLHDARLVLEDEALPIEVVPVQNAEPLPIEAVDSDGIIAADDASDASESLASS